LAKAEDELRTAALSQPCLRLGSGELSDSLAWEERVPRVQQILDLLERFPNVVFEFKTKSDAVRALLAAPHVPANIVCAWSLNPPSIIASEEPGSAALADRLAAMRAVQERGYRLAIHFDPLILVPDWRDLYRDLVREVARHVRPDNIVWWSLGALRFTPALREYIFRRRARSLFWGELVSGFDGKYRYFKPLRRELFHAVASEIAQLFSAQIPLYLCMEDEEMWRDVLPASPPVAAEINRRLYDSVFR
jgi:spore photoproduct lyase